MNKQNIIAEKLNLDYRTVANICNNEELSNRIINEKVSNLNDYAKTSNYSLTVLKKLIKENRIPYFTTLLDFAPNKHKNGRPTFVFDNDLLVFESAYEYRSLSIFTKIDSIDWIFDTHLEILNNRDKEIIQDCFEFKSTEFIAQKNGVTTERARQIIHKAFRRLNNYIKHLKKYNSLVFDIKELESKKRELEHYNKQLEINLEKNNFNTIKEYNPNHIIEIMDLDISVRLYNCLKANEIKTLGDIAIYSENDFLKFRNFGKKSLTELYELLPKYNIVLNK
jgi:hypothetical protein